MDKSIKGSLILLLTALIWGTAFVAQSVGMEYIGPFTFNFVRTFIGAVTLVPIISCFRLFDTAGKKRDISLKNTVIGGVVCGVALFLASSFQQSGIALTTAGKAGFITALYIVIVPLLELFIYKKTSSRMWLCVFIAISGFYLLCVKDDLGICRGDVLVLVCAVLFAVHIMAVDFFNTKNTDGMLMSCIQFFTAAAFLCICTFLFEKPEIKSVLSAWRPILYAGVMSCGVAYTLQIIGQRYTPPTTATLIMSLESVFAALAGWLILNEKMSFKELTGCVLVFAAVIAAQLQKKEGKEEK